MDSLNYIFKKKLEIEIVRSNTHKFFTQLFEKKKKHSIKYFVTLYTHL